MLKIQSIDLKKIYPDKNQPRKKFDEVEIKELATSISKYGLLQPIIIRKNNSNLATDDPNQTYTIIAGERRYRASRLLKLGYIDCIVREKENSKEVSLIENIQRKNLNKIEEAKAIYDIITENNYTQEEVAKILSKSRPYITNALRLLNLDEKTQEALLNEKISDAHARVLAGIQIDKERNSLLDKILNEKLSVRESEKLSREIKKKDIFLENFLRETSERMDTNVYVKGNSKKGTLCIDFYKEEDLEKIINKILELY